MTTPAFPPGRYGRRRERAPARRSVTLLLGGLALLLALGLAVVAYRNQNNGVRAAVTRYSVTDREVTVSFAVDRPVDRSVVCVVRARQKDGAEVGRAQVSIPAGPSHITVTYRLPTRSRAVTGEVYGCAPRTD